MDEKGLKRMLRQVNKYVRSWYVGYGVLLFEKDGSGGIWLPDASPIFGGFVIPIPWEPMTLKELREIVTTQEE